MRYNRAKMGFIFNGDKMRNKNLKSENLAASTQTRKGDFEKVLIGVGLAALAAVILWDYAKKNYSPASKTALCLAKNGVTMATDSFKKITLPRRPFLRSTAPADPTCDF